MVSFSFTKGILFFTNIISPAVFNLLLKLPAGWKRLKSNFPNFFFFISAIERASPRASCDVVEDVGTIPYPDSNTSGIKSLIFEDLYKYEFLFETMPIKMILFDLAYLIIFFNSSVLPE